MQLNPSEVNHAYYHDTDFMHLVNRMSEYQPLIDLDIFTDKTVMRMNDRSLVEELAAYLIKGITDKRNAVEELFESKIKSDVSELKFTRFCNIIDRVNAIQDIKPINETRYKQRNDFYTLFCFIDKHIDDSIIVLKEQYKGKKLFTDFVQELESLKTPLLFHDIVNDKLIPFFGGRGYKMHKEKKYEQEVVSMYRLN